MAKARAGACKVSIRAAALAVAVVGASCSSLGNAPDEPALAGFPPMASGSPPGASPEAITMAKALGRGVNHGDVFEPPQPGSWGVPVQGDYADKIVEAGFNSVRLPVRWSNHASGTADAVIDESFALQVDALIDPLLRRGLIVVLNLHHYRQLDGDPLHPGESRVDPALLRPRFLNIWKQIAHRYRNRPNKLIFELYNEPHGAQQSTWNDLAARALGVVRQSNPLRVVVIGPTGWNSASELRALALPNDPNLIVTVHNYEPIQFTHQGATWVPGSDRWYGTTCCSVEQQAAMRTPLDLAAAWSARHRYPVFLGEFGSHAAAPMGSRQAFARTMRDEAEKRGMSWSYWNLASPTFGIYSVAEQAWVAPIKEALLGP